jgi:hypothetical protein
MLILIGRQVMNRILRFAGLVLASLTISTVAMAQQGGGGNGGGNGGGGGGGGDPSVLEVLRQDARNARLTRAVQTRPGASDCLTHVCEQPPGTQRPPRGQIAQFDASCSGGEVLELRRPDGRTVRYLCRNL